MIIHDFAIFVCIVPTETGVAHFEGLPEHEYHIDTIRSILEKTTAREYALDLRAVGTRAVMYRNGCRYETLLQAYNYTLISLETRLPRGVAVKCFLNVFLNSLCLPLDMTSDGDDYMIRPDYGNVADPIALNKFWGKEDSEEFMHAIVSNTEPVQIIKGIR